ncbi:MAG: hypothetical protein LHW46_07055, partial [Candidatus Cloacimonetes bacterium]|nr:hypothetical protein [Candidatus Cloacimonadota bacterium]
MGTPDQELIREIENKAGFTGDALAAAKVLSDAAEAYVEHKGGEIPTGIKVFRGGVWETVNIPLNIAQGDVTEKALAKALVGVLSGVAIGAAAAAVTAGAPFIIGFGAAVAFGLYAGNKISEAVDNIYDTVIGPDFTFVQIADDIPLITVNYSLTDAIVADAGWFHGESFKGILAEKNLSEWTLNSTHSVQGGTIVLKNNTFEFVGQSLSSLRKKGSYLELIVENIKEFGDFELQITNGSTHHITNLFHKSSVQMASLAKGDTAVMSALVLMKSYAISDVGGQFPHNLYSDAYIEEKAKMLYWHNTSKWHVNGIDGVNVELSRYNIHYTDMMNSIEFGEGTSGLDYDKKVIFGSFMDDTIEGGDYEDKLFGDEGTDTLNGNAGNDYLEGGKGYDTLNGGADYDTYISDNGDTIMDSDGKGIVYFEKEHLTGGTLKAGASCDTTEFYYGDGGVYSYDKLSKQLTFTKNGTNETLSIENFTNTDLGITLSGAPACPTTTGDCPKPINPIFSFNFSLPTPIRAVTYGTGGGGSTYSGGGGGGGGGGSYTPHTSTPAPTPVIECVNSPVYHSAGTGGGGSSTGPIVLDLNRDGITSISIATSQALFDYDNDGVKENTAWIQSSDALLVNDKNSDGIINDATELFGNYTHNSDNSIAKSGYQALSYYDSNSDNVIDATDTRFNELSLWIDSNQDGVTDTGELNTLSEMGVTSITLNSTTPYIPSSENTNTIIQETTFTDASGEGIMRDVLFRYENTSKPTDGVYFDMDGNGIQEKMTRWTDPNQWMIVKDINNDGQITSGKEVVGNHMTLPNGTKAADTIQALKTFDINNDGVIDASDNSGLAFWTDRNHNGLTDVGELEALGAAGAIQTIKLNPYQTLLSGYDNNHDGEINSSDKLYNYLYIQTNADDSVTLYLPDNAQAKEMIAGYTGGESIQTPQGEKIIKTILFYEGYGMTLNDTLEGTDGSETLEGSSRSETLRGKGGRDIIDARGGNDIIEGGEGSDKLMGGEGNDTYIYNRGDGKDLIIDSSGNDTIAFAEGISKDDLIIKTNGADISIYLKDGSKPLSELNDQIIIKDWHTISTLKTVTFNDGTSLDTRDIVLMFATDKNDTIYATQNSETIIGGKGNDLLQGRGGNDTYVFNRGDGKDVIIDSAGLDTLSFSEGISTEDIIV